MQFRKYVLIILVTSPTWHRIGDVVQYNQLLWVFCCKIILTENYILLWGLKGKVPIWYTHADRITQFYIKLDMRVKIINQFEYFCGYNTKGKIWMLCDMFVDWKHNWWFTDDILVKRHTVFILTLTSWIHFKAWMGCQASAHVVIETFLQEYAAGTKCS